MADGKMQDFSIRVITWNVAGTSPSEDLQDLLGVREPFDKSTLPDLLAIGYQEVSMGPVNVVSDALFEQEWITPLRHILSKFDYVKLVSYRLQGLVLVILVRRLHLLHIKNIYPTCVRTGLLGAWGNKGATIVSLQAYGASMSFTNSHLAAHDHEYKRRLDDYAAIAATWCAFSPCEILGHDYVFWFGDLNFRLDETITMNNLRKAIQDGTIMDMLQFDQLKRAQRDHQAFETMSEADISFKPTFKYQTGTTNFKLNSRRPAWTDRILYSCNESKDRETKLEIAVSNYQSHENYVQSDHKPVSARFSVKVLREVSVRDRVYFFNTGNWSVSRGYEFWFCTSTNAQLHNTDWIGLLKDNFTSLDEYSGYVWVNMQSLNTSTYPDIENPDLPTPRRIFQQTFSDQIVVLPGCYRLVYFRSKCDVLGVSDPFEVTAPSSRRQVPPVYYRVSS